MAMHNRKTWSMGPAPCKLALEGRVMAILLEMILLHPIPHKQMHKANATAVEASRSIQLALSLPEVNAKIFGGCNKAYVMYPIL